MFDIYYVCHSVGGNARVFLHLLPETPDAYSAMVSAHRRAAMKLYVDPVATKPHRYHKAYLIVWLV